MKSRPSPTPPPPPDEETNSVENTIPLPPGIIPVTSLLLSLDQIKKQSKQTGDGNDRLNVGLIKRSVSYKNKTGCEHLLTMLCNLSKCLLYLFRILNTCIYFCFKTLTFRSMSYQYTRILLHIPIFKHSLGG